MCVSPRGLSHSGDICRVLTWSDHHHRVFKCVQQAKCHHMSACWEKSGLSLVDSAQRDSVLCFNVKSVLVRAAVRKIHPKRLWFPSNRSTFMKSGPAVLQPIKCIKCRQQPWRRGGGLWDGGSRGLHKGPSLAFNIKY